MTTRKRTTRTSTALVAADTDTAVVAEEADAGLYQCVRCKQTYPADEMNKWGSEGVGDGYGPNPICTNLVDDKPARPGNPQHVCRGELTYIG